MLARMETIERLFAWLYSLMILIFSGASVSVGGAVIAIFIAVILVGIDFVTGVYASKREGRSIKIRSRRMRWSLAKILVYSGCISLTLLIGMLLNGMEIALGATEEQKTGALIFALYCVRVEAYFICWIETVSIIENLRRRFPDNMFLKFLHYIVAVEFVKKIPKLETFLKEKDVKPYEYEEHDRLKNQSTK